MTKREKIIVGITLLAGVYGVFSLLAPSSFRRPAKAPPDLNETRKFVEEISVGVAEKRSRKPIAPLLEIISSPWETDPFVAPSLLKESIAAAPAKAPEPEEIHEETELIYGGFIRIGERITAIINDDEYGVGDPIEDLPLVVERITPEEVVVTDDNNRKRVIPLVELQ